MKPNRKGTTILEAIAALTLLAAGSVFTAQVLATCAAHRSAGQQMVAAQLQAANIAERVDLLPYEKLNDTTLHAWSVSPSLLELIPNAKLNVVVSPSTAGGLPQKRVAIKIEWPAADEAATGVSLTTWRYAPQEETP